MAFCSKCGKELPDGVRFCLECGAPVNQPPAEPQPQEPDADQTEKDPVSSETESGASNTADASGASDTAGAAAPQSYPTYTPPPVYAPPPPNQYAQYQPPAAQEPEKEPGIGNWLGTFFLMIIPVVNLVMLIVWACGVSKYKCKANFARARLIFAAIWITISLILCILLSSLIVGFVSNVSSDISNSITEYSDEHLKPDSDEYQDFHDFMDAFSSSSHS